MVKTHTRDTQVHTSDIRGFMVRTHTSDILVHTGDIRITYEYMRVT